MGNATYTAPTAQAPASERFFDQLAASYDETFTTSKIGRAQRNRVWANIVRTFRAQENILELNCGTGIDALFMSKMGISVFACDSSRQMIEQAQLRCRRELTSNSPTFHYLPTEHLDTLSPETPFDGVFSNFSGLNCVENLDLIAESLSSLVKPQGQLLLCLSTRFCLLEVAYYLAHGNWQKVTRRWGGRTEANLGDLKLPVYYPTVRQLRDSFAPHFVLQSFTGVGVVIPPSYLESWVQRHLASFCLLCRVENVVAGLPGFRIIGDHILLRFERVSA
jgi:ubiquinone/menaquinone biosynthesis C-methylase UbiE